MTRSRIVTALVVVVALFALAQLVRPARTNPPEDPSQRLGARLVVDPAVASTLDRACADCHSNRTTWPWYAHVAPVSWLIARDVTNGRAEMNLSSFETLPAERQKRKLAKMCKEIRGGDMPPFYYVWMHPAAKLSPADVDLVCNWTASATSAASAAVSPAATP